MAESRKVVQLHKKDNTSEQWIPLTSGGCVELTDFTNNNNTGTITQSDTVNSALAKLENDKYGEAQVNSAINSKITSSINSSAEGSIGKAIKDAVGVVYRPQGSRYFTNSTNPGQGLDHFDTFLKNTNVGFVYNVIDQFQITNENKDHFAEGQSSGSLPKTIPAGSNLVVIDMGSSYSTNRYRYDVLAMSIQGGGSGTVSEGTAYRLAWYPSSGATVDDLSSVTFNTSSNRLEVPNLYSTGAVTAATVSSDARLKKDIQDFNGMDILDKLHFKTFKWNSIAAQRSDALPYNHTSYGVIAQDSDNIIEDFVFDMPDGSGYKGVRYEKLIPIMAQAIKELKEEVADLKKQLKGE